MRGLFALLAAWMTAGPAMAIDVNTMWEFSKPAESETRFRAELARQPAGSREALETMTQIARTQLGRVADA